MQTTTETNTRTATGREALDAKVLAALKKRKEPAASSDLTTATGASMFQVRASLHRLIEAGKVVRTGETRASRYALAS